MGKTKKKTAKAAKGNALLLSSAMPSAHLVATGGRFNGGELIALWHAVKPKMAAHRADFESLGFTSSWASAMDALGARIESTSAHKSELAADAFPTGAALNDVIARCKDWRRSAATRVSISPKLAARAPKIQTGSSPVALDKTIRALLPLVASRDLAAPGGAAMKTQGQKLLGELAAQVKKHKDATGKVSPAVRDRNADEGVFYEELKRLARAARGVVPAEAHLFAPSQQLGTRLPSRAKKSKADGASSTPSAAAPNPPAAG
ncbi:MAG TPA: hypothetical protein VGH28_23665 [Polyangiaceae bacterium]|jgi:hypothetical protein